MFHPTRGGTRGGAAEFSWSDVKGDKDRENYLGHSINAPTGRWLNGRDVRWFEKDNQKTQLDPTLTGEQVEEKERKRKEKQRKKEIRDIKRAEIVEVNKRLNLPPPTFSDTESSDSETEPTAGDGGEGSAAISSEDKKLAKKLAKYEVKEKEREEKRKRKEERDLIRKEREERKEKHNRKHRNKDDRHRDDRDRDVKSASVRDTRDHRDDRSDRNRRDYDYRRDDDRRRRDYSEDRGPRSYSASRRDRDPERDRKGSDFRRDSRDRSPDQDRKYSQDNRLERDHTDERASERSRRTDFRPEKERSPDSRRPSGRDGYRADARYYDGRDRSRTFRG